MVYFCRTYGRALAGFLVLLLCAHVARATIVLNTLDSFLGAPYSASPQGTLVSHGGAPTFPFVGIYSLGGVPGDGGWSGPSDSTNGGVFSMTPAIYNSSSYGYSPISVATFTNLHYFTTPEGTAPQASPVNSSDGTIYGTTFKGALSNPLFPKGMGSVYKLSTSGTLTVLYRFGTLTNSSGQPIDGAGSKSALVLMGDGNYYGATYYGGTNGYAGNGLGYGTIFKITTNGTLTTLFHFNGTNGSHPNSLTVSGGYLFGTTVSGGSRSNVVDSDGNTGYGTVFRFNTNGTFTTLYSFGNMTNLSGQAMDGCGPCSVKQGSDLAWYGLAASGGSNTTVISSNGATGCGTAFRVTTNGAFSLLYSFGSVPGIQYVLDGANPCGYLLQGLDGSFFGVTENAGYYNGGTIFQVFTNYGLITLYSFGQSVGGTFSLPEGRHPKGGLVNGVNAFYGTTTTNGSGVGGTIYSIGPAIPSATNASIVVTNLAGDTRSFGFAMNSLYALGYQWKLRGSNLFNNLHFGGAFSNMLTLSNIAVADAGTYVLISTNVAGGATNTVEFQVKPALFTTSPTNATYRAGQTNIFKTVVSSIYPPSYQWQRNGTNLSDTWNITGTTTTNLTVLPVSFLDAGSYALIVSNSAGMVQSSNAVLKVTNVITAPTVGPVSVTGEQIAFNWNAVAGQGYKLQFTTNLQTASWQDVSGPMVATNGLINVSDSMSRGQCFYRIILYP